MRIRQPNSNTYKPDRTKRRAAALIIALVLAMCLTMLIVATQLQVVSQLKTERGQRDYDRALEMAEAGANAYLNYVSAHYNTNITPWGTADAPCITTGIPSVAQIQAAIRSHAIVLGSGSNAVAGTQCTSQTGSTTTMGLICYPAQETLATYPPTNSQFGYFVILTAPIGFSINLVSYGYSNGIVRRIQVGGTSTSIFDWAGIYVLDNLSGDTAWTQHGSASTVGAVGGEGHINWGNGTIFDGPVILAGNGALRTAAFNPSDPSILASTTSNPAGNHGSHVLASLPVRRAARSLGIETADTAANNWSGAGTGVEYFRNNNDNATGFRYLLQNKSTHLIYEYSVPANIGTGTLSLPNLPDDGNSIPSGYSYYGLRVYPGNYFVEGVSQRQDDTFTYYRTFNDTDRSSSSVAAGRLFSVSGVVSQNGAITLGEPANPNAGQSGSRNIRYWIGHHYTSGVPGPNNTHINDESSQFEQGNAMEYPAFASRFRIYDASSGSLSLQGSQSGPAFNWNVNLLAYNSDPRISAGAPYGDVTFTNSTYVRGSVIAWTVDQGGSCIIEKQATEGGTAAIDDKLVYQITTWKDLP